MLNRADIAAVVCDLDGTVYLGDHVIPGVPAAIARLRASGRRVLFLSNNPTKTPDQYVSKLTKLGIPAIKSFIIIQLAFIPFIFCSQAFCSFS